MMWYYPSASTTTTVLKATSASAAIIPLKGSYWLTRILFLRALAFVYGVAFLVAYKQNRGLIGDNGITPARHVLDRAQVRGRNTRLHREEWLEKYGRVSYKNPFKRLGFIINQQTWYKSLRERLWDRADGLGRPVTSVLWLARNRQNLNPWLDGIALTGMSVASLMFVLGCANVPLLLTLWICQRSLMAVGGPWYGYGWEPQLAELGFHALFLVPLLSLHKFTVKPPMPIIWCIRWYLFRIMMGAGLIKLKPTADKKWKDGTAMNYFYETQPVPNPFTRKFHQMPAKWHTFEVYTNHFVEVVAPFLLFLTPRVGGLIQMAFQSVLIMSGNLSFLNWLTMVPALTCLDDAFLAKYFSPSTVSLARTAAATSITSPIRHFTSGAFCILFAYLSIPVVKNLCNKQQIMNGSFDPLRLCNTYGAFGSVNEERYELVVSAATNITGPWKEYEFQVKPGDVFRRPRWISPYHYRLDWQMWIASTVNSLERSPWLASFLLCLLQENPDVLELLKHNPFADEKEKPRYIRIDRYLYKFRNTKASQSSNNKEPFWDREYVGRFFPRQGVASIVGLQDLVGSP